jgi:hypothetical protein
VSRITIQDDFPGHCLIVTYPAGGQQPVGDLPFTNADVATT